MKFPEYVFMISPGRKAALRLIDSEKGVYHRSAGSWDVSAEWRGNKLYTIGFIGASYSSGRDKELIACSKEQYEEDNKGYV